ncbi:MAG: hypothetical protein FWE44_03245 [Defluviitaleaceae bacterium]|nr:hypothetical protein [Defluviitaleaceae bacterium]
MNDYATIDLSDIPEIKKTAKSRKNPYFEKIMKNGFSITEHYGPEDVAAIIKGVCTRKIDILSLDPEEQKALERYKKAHGYE